MQSIKLFIKRDLNFSMKFSRQTHRWWGGRDGVQRQRRPFWWLLGSLRSSRTYWSSFITTTCTPLRSVPHTLPPPPTHRHTHTHTPAWTNQTFGGRLSHRRLHNGAFVTGCPTLPSAYTAMAHRAYCNTHTHIHTHSHDFINSCTHAEYHLSIQT